MIKVLDQNTIDKIAAGEVIERPSSVVKELIENSIDAGSSAITVELKDGGKTYIRITDNGSGINKEEIRIAYQRHATSKLQDADGLSNIMTLGFRGEALSTIAAVSQTEMITKTADSLVGVKYTIHGGKEVELTEVGAPQGTTFIVKNLFYNTPARLKFLKSNMTEGSYINDLVIRLALSHPDISFRFINNGKNVVETSGNGKLREVIYSIYGRDITKNMLEVNHDEEGIHIEGYIGKPFISKGNRGFENYFVNGRYIKSGIVSRAIEEAYKTFIMQHKFPFTVLNLTLDTEMCDVNVHPTKMEFRYNNEKALFSAVYHAVSNALAKKEIIPEANTGYEKQAKAEPAKPTYSANKPVETVKPKLADTIPVKPEALKIDYTKTNSTGSKSNSAGNGFKSANNKSSDVSFSILEAMLPESFRKELANSKPIKTEFDNNKASETVVREISEYKVEKAETKTDVNKIIDSKASKPEVGRDEESIVDEAKVVESKVEEVAKQEEYKQEELFNDIFLSKKAIEKHNIIGQVFDTYWITEYNNELYFMDQHAAHEKVNYERFLKAYKDKTITSQMIYPAEVVSVSSVEKNLILNNWEIFANAGFDIEEFGGNEFKLIAVPFNLYGLSARDVFEEFLGTLVDDARGSEITEDIFVRKIASMSCKAAIKGNQKVSREEAEHLIEELMTLDNPYTCPHGRPTLIKMSKAELEKKFRRIV